jgi:hypothetical protein
MIADNQVELLKVQGAINAEPILAALRANGIPAAVVGEAVGRVYGLTLNGLGVVTIVVAKEHEEKARELLAAGELRQLEATEADADPEGAQTPGR